jgi:hypothetical protein
MSHASSLDLLLVAPGVHLYRPHVPPLAKEYDVI